MLADLCLPLPSRATVPPGRYCADYHFSNFSVQQSIREWVDESLIQALQIIAA
jgi:hypothetical protein